MQLFTQWLMTGEGLEGHEKPGYA